MIYAIEAVGSYGSCDQKGHRHGLVKFGKARRPQKRLKELSTGSPHPLKLLASVDWFDDIEPVIHAAFKDRRKNGEWFSPDDSLMSFVSTMMCPHGATDEQKFLSCMLILVERLCGLKCSYAYSLGAGACRAYMPVPPDIRRQLQ